MSSISTSVNHPTSGVGSSIDPSSGNFLIDPNALALIVDIAASQVADRTMFRQPSPIVGDVPTQMTLRFQDGVYVGEVQNGEPHGRGTMDYYPALERKRYEGQWQDGEFHGKGILVRSNGDQYEGDWKNGLFHGKGVFTNNDGSRTYQGEWQFGYQHGQGEMRIMSDGKHSGSSLVVHRCEGEKGSFHVGAGEYITEYKGEYVCGFPHGKGSIEKRSSTGYGNLKYTGWFISGYYHGEGCLSSRTTFCEGTWISGSLVKGTYTYSRDYDYENYEEGVFRDGDLWEGEYRCKRLHTDGIRVKENIYKVKDGVQHQEIIETICCIL